MKHPILQGSLPDTTCLYLMCLACAAFPPSLFSAASNSWYTMPPCAIQSSVGAGLQANRQTSELELLEKFQGSLRDSPPSCLPQTRPAKVRDPLDTSARSTSRLRAFQVNPLTINPLQKRKDHLGRNVILFDVLHKLMHELMSAPKHLHALHPQPCMASESASRGTLVSTWKAPVSTRVSPSIKRELDPGVLLNAHEFVSSWELYIRNGYPKALIKPDHRAQSKLPWQGTADPLRGRSSRSSAVRCLKDSQKDTPYVRRSI